MSNQYIINSALGEPYIHRTKRGYELSSTGANYSSMESEALRLYKTQINNLKGRHGVGQTGKDLKAKKAIEFIDEFDILIETLNKTKDIGINNTINESANIGKVNESLERLSSKTKIIGDAIDAYNGVSKQKKDSLRAGKSSASVQVQNAYQMMKNIHTAPKDEIAKLDKLSATTNKLGSAKSTIDSMRLNIEDIQKDFSDVAKKNLYNSGVSDFVKNISSIKNVNVKGFNNKQTTSVKVNKNQVSKGIDVAANGSVDSSSANLTLSLNTKKTDASKGVGNKININATGSLGDLLSQANAMLDNSTYHLLNSAVHDGTDSAIFQSAKMKATAILATNSLAKLGEKNASYYILYGGRTIELSNFMESLSTANMIPFDMNISGISRATSKAKKLRKGNSNIERYIRSREALQIFLSLKTTLANS